MPAERAGVVELGLTGVRCERWMAKHGSTVRDLVTGSFPRMGPLSRGAIALLVCTGAVALAPARVLAHTELDFSLPANGTTVGEPVEEISVGFTDLVALVGNGFEVHDPQGNLLTPFVVTDDNKVFRFQLDPPLAGGLVVVDYHVRALDGDVQEGSFSFTVAAPVPASTIAATTSIAPATTATSSPTTTAATTTTQPAAAAAPTTVPGTTASSALPTDDSDADGERERTLMFVVLLGIAGAAAGYLVVRSRRPA
jgi:methionine-rich copper-binding protein CopC